jgi:FG-GAP-like repeat
MSLARGESRPYLVDWNRAGHTDLVIGYPGRWTFEVALGPLALKKDMAYLPTKSVELPPVPGGLSPIHFSFADWDGDGRTDLLVGVDSGGPPPRRYSIYWFRNTSDTGPPKFAKGSHLLDIPEPWELHALTAVNWGGDAHPSLVVSVSKGWKLGEGGRGWWPVTSELWLYQRKA